jgi:two-component system NtrC family sensor kinase
LLFNQPFSQSKPEHRVSQRDIHEPSQVNPDINMPTHKPFANLTIRTRLLIAFGVLLLLMLTINVIALRQMRELYDMQAKIENGQITTQAGKLDHFDRVLLAQTGIALVNENAQRAMELLLIRFQANGDLQSFQHIFNLQQDTSDEISSIYQKFEQTLDTEEERHLFANIRVARKAYVDERSKIENAAPSISQKEILLTLDQSILPRLKTYMQAWNALIDLEKKLSLEAQQRISDRYHFAQNSLLGLLILALIFSVVVAYLVMRQISNSLGEINTAANKIASGNLHEPIVIRSGDEISALAKTFNQMAAALQTQQQQLLDHQKNLEDRVQERTQEITLANAELVKRNSQLAQAHAQILQTEKLAAIGQLAAGVAHEINTPIAYIQSNVSSLHDYFVRVLSMLHALREGHLELQEQTLHSTPELDFLRIDEMELFQETQAGLLRIKKIVGNLRDFAQIDSENKWTYYNLHNGLNSTLEVLAPEIGANMAIEKDYACLPEIECIPSQINQVFLNVLLNAIQANPEQHGSISVRTRLRQNMVCIDIQDTGCGIAEENLTRIFDPFFTTKPIGQGTGLGLSIAYGLVRHHNGWISVKSVPEQGTCISISLPVRQTSTSDEHTELKLENSIA